MGVVNSFSAEDDLTDEVVEVEARVEVVVVVEAAGAGAVVGRADFLAEFGLLTDCFAGRDGDGEMSSFQRAEHAAPVRPGRCIDK